MIPQILEYTLCGHTLFSLVMPMLGLGCNSKPVTVDSPTLSGLTMQQTWAQYSPYYPAAEYQAPPPGCDVVQVNLLQRHGARYPKKSDGKAMKKSVKRLKGAKSFRDASLDFVANYTYALGTDDLVPFGAAQSFEAGQLHYGRYASLVNEDMLPFVRASGSDRVINSALNWTAGFANASNQQYTPILSVVFDQSSNDTLDDNMCPNVGTSDDQTKTWLDVFAPEIRDRLNHYAPGADLKKKDVENLMSLCPFETVAYEQISPWCALFTEEEWASYEYHGDLYDYYGNGYGQQLGPVQGVGYVNELLARLTGRPVQDNTQTNHTLDSSPVTFPLDRTFYADFSHDNEMISIYSALGLFVQPHHLDPTHPNPMRTWVESKLVPFSGRMTTEKLECTINGERGEYVRILVNDALQPLPFCAGTGDGLCTLDNFVESQQYARSNGAGDWELCSD
ncbi:histidine phosphatase superfamily [Suillus paluster]|uniref:histidine phosphatase superfamily n=1 Tax=Suillus paluster TaxID=48578 RepID=UPI001B868E4C|nr:histidine phosphatase superfamily [Suillus paluster]KAG1743648.1 histidine phosphatase superfamily [Suillus paluster]